VNSLATLLEGAIGGAVKRRAARGRAGLALSPAYCREVARWYEDAPRFGAGAAELNAYELFKLETLEQFESLLAAGFTVRPWQRGGQPYATSRELRARVADERALYVYMTADGHGPDDGHTDSDHINCGDHPMLELSGYSINGVAFTYNDLFRAVHDLFGHVLQPNAFSIEGELCAVMSHLTMYSGDAGRVVLSETAAQICWYYYGPHLLGTAGEARRYPPQKVLVMPKRLVDGFWRMFRLDSPSIADCAVAA
jgi:hypothetical protein